jgi:hypothetical protein
MATPRITDWGWSRGGSLQGLERYFFADHEEHPPHRQTMQTIESEISHILAELGYFGQPLLRLRLGLFRI